MLVHRIIKDLIHSKEFIVWFVSYKFSLVILVFPLFFSVTSVTQLFALWVLDEEFPGLIPVRTNLGKIPWPVFNSGHLPADMMMINCCGCLAHYCYYYITIISKNLYKRPELCTISIHIKYILSANISNLNLCLQSMFHLQDNDISIHSYSNFYYDVPLK